MATITEEYVSLEVAKLLREKGFNEPCFAYYDLFHDSTGTTLKLYKKFPRNPLNKQYLNVPTLQMAMKWLREKNIIIVIQPEYFNLESKCSAWGVEIWCDDNYEKMQGNFSTYEAACEEAIKYCLTNLI